ncbi:hypothetical protein [Filimonas effusa]|uniref:DUF4252 domain-containing protein n=1 Tax=Filimonas effusa TaxID=2508721 RepID=A0A4V1M9Y0_9BACT|nr:hypothetical protein [Filimonas effusa]RXK83244.1 hypothetical protein ESB13_14100 [Filimonas effusa]
MKSFSLTSIFLLVLFTASFGQVKDAAANLKQQAANMGKALISGDLKTFVLYTYPSIVKSMGGAPKMIEVVKKGIDEMKEKGINFEKVTFGEPAQMVMYGKEWQTTIAQHIEIKMPEGILQNTSTLIAISSDNGVNWTFVDASGKDITSLRKILPNLNPAIKIPPRQRPVLKS